METPKHCKKFMILRHYEGGGMASIGHYCFQCQICGDLIWNSEEE